MSSVADALAWPFEDGRWLGTLILQGVIGVIPLIGWISAYGWMLRTIDNYRAGRRELAPAGLYLERGLPLFLVSLVYWIVFSLPWGAIIGAGIVGNPGRFLQIGDLIELAVWLLFAFLSPSIILHTYERGISGGFDVGAVWETASSNAANAIVAGLFIFVAEIIAGLGVILCCVGLLITIPYAFAVTAGVVTWFEQQQAGPYRPA